MTARTRDLSPSSAAPGRCSGLGSGSGPGPQTRATEQAATRADVLAAIAAVEACCLSPSEAIAVVRGARRLDGPLTTNLATACDLLADDYLDRAHVHRHAAGQLRAREVHDVHSQKGRAPHHPHSQKDRAA